VEMLFPGSGVALLDGTPLEELFGIIRQLLRYLANLPVAK